MRSSAGTLLGGAKLGWESALKPVPCSIAPGSLNRTFRPIVPNPAESAGPMLAEFSAVWAYTVRGGFERRGVKAGPQATAIAARSGLYASERNHHWNWFEFVRTLRHSNHGQAGLSSCCSAANGTENRVKQVAHFVPNRCHTPISRVWACTLAYYFFRFVSWPGVPLRQTRV